MVLAPERVKNNSAHLVPLSPLAVKLFRKAEARAERGDLLFPNRATGGHLTPHAVAVAMRRSRPVFAFKREATPHDLRRTLASGLAELGFPRIIHDKVLNHIHGDRSTIAGIYDQYEYAKEKRQALEARAVHLEGLVMGRTDAGNLVPIRRSAGA